MSFAANIVDLVEESDAPLVQRASWWCRAPLGWVCEILNGFPFPSQDFSIDKGAPLIRIRDVTAGRTETRYAGNIPEGYWVESGDYVVGMDGDFNARIWRSERALLNQRVCKITANGCFLDPNFLAYVLPGYLKLINDHTPSVTVKHLSSRTLQETPIPLPSLAEQGRIAAKLDQLFERTTSAREELAHIPMLVEHYKQAILRKAFSGELTANWREKHGRDLPDAVQLGSVASDFSYGSAAKSAPTGKIPVLRMGNIQDGKLDWSDLVFTSDEREIEKYSLSPGDVLFNRTNSPALVGKTALYTGEHPAIYAGYLIRVRCGESLDPRYLTYALNSPDGRDYCWQVKTDGVSQSNINAKKLAAFSFLLPEIDEQQEVIRLIESAFDWIERVSGERDKAATMLDHLDSGLLGKAFKGELVPQDPSDEPAEQLLERIRLERGAQTPVRRGRRARVGA